MVSAILNEGNGTVDVTCTSSPTGGSSATGFRLYAGATNIPIDTAAGAGPVIQIYTVSGLITGITRVEIVSQPTFTFANGAPLTSSQVLAIT